MRKPERRYSRILSLALGAAALSGLLALADWRGGSETKIRPYVSWSGPDSKVKERSFARAHNEDEWTKIWEQNTGAAAKRDHVQRPFVPHVDFDQCTLIAIFQGAGVNSNGVVVSEIIDEPDRIVLRYEESSYQVAFGFNEQPKELPQVYPYGLFVVPKTTKPIVLEENTQGLKDQPNKWTQRAKLE